MRVTHRLLILLPALLLSAVCATPAAAMTAHTITATPEAVPDEGTTEVVIAGNGFTACLQTTPATTTQAPPEVEVNAIGGTGSGSISGGVRILWNGQAQVVRPAELSDGGFTTTILVTPETGASSIVVEARCDLDDPDDSAASAVFAETALTVTPPSSTSTPTTTLPATSAATAPPPITSKAQPPVIAAPPVTAAPLTGVASPGGPASGAPSGDTSTPPSFNTSGPGPLAVLVLIAVVAAMVGLTALRRRRKPVPTGQPALPMRPTRVAPHPPTGPTVQAIAVVDRRGAVHVRRTGPGADLALRVVLRPDAGALRVTRSHGGTRQ